MNTIWKIAIIASDDGTNNEDYQCLEADMLHQSHNPQIEYVVYHFNPETRLARIRKIASCPNQCRFFEDRETRENVSIFNKDELICFFETHVKVLNQEVRYFVITWGHGAGFAFFNTLAKIQSFLYNFNKEEATSSFSEAEKDELIGSWWPYQNLASTLMANYGVEIAHTTRLSPSLLNAEKQILSTSENLLFSTAKFPEALTIDDFADIIKQTIKKIDLLVCVNCFMQTFETGFKLKDCVDIMLAAQTSIPFAGIDYRSILAKLHKNTETATEELAKKIIDEFAPKYLQERYESLLKVYNSLSLNEIVLSANKLSRYNELADCLSKIVDSILKNRGELKEIILTTRQACYDVTSYADAGIIDITHFLLVLLLFIGYIPGKYDGLSNEIWKFLNIRSECIVNIYATNYSTRIKNIFEVASSSPQFLSIFLPPSYNSEIAEKIKSSYAQKNAQFISATNWASIFGLI